MGEAGRLREHILVIHRWRDRHALYGNYIDHGVHSVTYVTSDMGRQSVPDAAAAVVVVRATDDFESVRVAADELSSTFGAPRRIVALNEGDLDTGAALRRYIGCSGQDPVGLARFRDKLIMAEVLSSAGINVPAFSDAPDPEAVQLFGDVHGWPVVVKPRRGTASRDVFRLDCAEDLALMNGLRPEPRLVQTYCADPIYHVDGLWTGTELGPWRASRYVNTCVEFVTGQVLGSVEIDDEDLLRPLGSFTAEVAGALSAQPWVFHLEAFVGATNGGGPRLTFLEAGYRVGGAEIPFVWREVHGVDLMAAAFDVQLGRQPTLGEPDDGSTGGWLLVPTPVPAPCRVIAAELPLSRGEGPYARVVPAVGYTVPQVGGYEHVGARFRFRGSCTEDVEKAIITTASRFRLDCVPA